MRTKADYENYLARLALVPARMQAYSDMSVKAANEGVHAGLRMDEDHAWPATLPWCRQTSRSCRCTPACVLEQRRRGGRGHFRNPPWCAWGCTPHRRQKVVITAERGIERLPLAENGRASIWSSSNRVGAARLLWSIALSEVGEWPSASSNRWRLRRLPVEFSKGGMPSGGRRSKPRPGLQ